MINGCIVDVKKSHNSKGESVTWFMLTHEVGVDDNGHKKYLSGTDMVILKEPEMMEYIKTHDITVCNATIKGNKIEAQDASFNRFKQAHYYLKPFVVCSEIRNKKTDSVIGYIVAHSGTGRISNVQSAKVGLNPSDYQTSAITKTEFNSFCEQYIIKALTRCKEPRDLFKPVQNMKFTPNFENLRAIAREQSTELEARLLQVSSTAGIDMNTKSESFLSVYNVKNPLPIDYWEINDNKYTKKAKASKNAEVEAEKITKGVDLSTIYTPEQLKELKEAHANGVTVKKLYNPELSAYQMHVIANLEKDGFDGGQLAVPGFKEDVLDYLGANIRVGADISPVINPEYSVLQMTVILAGYMEGLDINVYANPSLPYKIMAQKRRDMLDATWCHNITDMIMEGTKYKFNS